MNKGIILHLENDVNLLSDYKRLFEGLEIDLDYVPCQNIKEFNYHIEENISSVKAVIFDMIGDGEMPEEFAGNPEFLVPMNESFENYNLPIFIYSGRLESVDGKYENSGTVFKVSKDDSIEIIFRKIAKLFDSGFIDVFCPGGLLETQISEELNKSFTKQFSKSSQIEEVIDSILNSSHDNTKDRVKNVFKRITVKSLANDLLAPIADKEDKVHPVEHFYIRQNKIKFWTGDIWTNKNTSENILILTPRCDLAKEEEINKNLIYCLIEPSPKFDLSAKPDKLLQQLNKHLVDNIEGKAKRYIPSNVFFPEGGMVNSSKHNVQHSTVIQNDYYYRVTLSDDLANEIIGKFAYYFLRTGITNINEQEFDAIIKSITNNTAEQNGKE